MHELLNGECHGAPHGTRVQAIFGRAWKTRVEFGYEGFDDERCEREVSRARFITEKEPTHRRGRSANGRDSTRVKHGLSLLDEVEGSGGCAALAGKHDDRWREASDGALNHSGEGQRIVIDPPTQPERGDAPLDDAEPIDRGTSGDATMQHESQDAMPPDWDGRHVV